MNTVRGATALLLVSLAIGAHAYAGGAGYDAPASVEQVAPATGVTRIIRADNYLGRTVRNIRKETLGEIIDLAINGQRATVAYAVMASGGFLGLGQTLHAIPLHELRDPGEDKDLVLDLSLAALKRQSGFDDDHWPQQAGLGPRSRNGGELSNAPAGASKRGGVAAPNGARPQ
ncbi:MAG: PRC-barrel domain-containing protein [Gammaproteobacteria bacterium]|nr:PRC-barrel domain-containing protein [Gammaproteobacteria bacterium]MBA3732500.1 PRC-barrel domain-containing protein [Gammaproteobacteria bacterium]